MLNNAPSPPPCQRDCFLIPATYEYITFHGRKVLADVVKLKILRWGDDPGLSGAPKVLTTRVLMTRKQTRQDGSRVQREDAVLLILEINKGSKREPRNIDIF